MGSASKLISRAMLTGQIVGQKGAVQIKDIWALRVRLQMEAGSAELALFKLADDSSCAPS